MKLQEIQKKIRRQKDLLATNGYGVIIFILWNFVKSIISVQPIVSPENNMTEISEETLIIISIVLIAFLGLLFLEVFAGIFTGIFAIREGQKDKKAGKKLRIFSTILCVFGLIFVFGDIASFISKPEFSTALFISMIIDFVYCMFAIFIVVSSMYLTRLYKLEKEANINEC